MVKQSFLTLNDLRKHLEEKGFSSAHLSQLSEAALYELCNQVNRGKPKEAQAILEQQMQQRWQEEEERKRKKQEIAIQETSKFQHLGGIYRISAALNKQGLK